MNRFSMFGLLIAAFFIAGCASQGDYYKAILSIETAHADAEAAKWRAVEAGMAKASPEGAAMSAMAIALGGKGGESVRTQIAAPKDGWDYFVQGVSAIGSLTQAVGGFIVPIRLAQEQRKGNEAMYASNALIEQSRGATQTAINSQTVGALSSLGIAAANAPRGAITTTTTNTASTTTNTNTLSGTGVIGNGLYAPITTTTTSSYNPVNPTARVCSTSSTGVLTCQGG